MRLMLSVAVLCFFLACGAPGADSAPGRALQSISTYESQGSKLQGSKLQGSKLQGSKLQGSKLQGSKLQGTALQGTVFSAQALVPGDAPPPAGWSFMGIGTCSPGANVTVSAAGKTLRVCWQRAPCDEGDPSELGAGAGSASFICHGGGEYNVLEADDGAPVDPSASAGTFPLTYPVSGTDFIGATLLGVAADGSTFDIHVDDIAADPGDPSGEILLYTLSYFDTDTASWQNLCETDLDGVAAALPVAGIWDDSGAHLSSDLVTFGCTAGVIAKCVRWGYKPWKTVNGKALASYHQACTRMARADYCGDGTPHTRDGTLIDVFDDVPIQTRTPNSGMLYEAAWTENGAYCVSKARWNIIGTWLLTECPSKIVLPGLVDVLSGCAMKLTTSGRSSIRTQNDSYIELFLPLL